MMGVYLKEYLPMVMQMVLEFSLIQKVTHIKENFIMMKLMDMVNIIIKNYLLIVDIGLTRLW